MRWLALLIVAALLVASVFSVQELVKQRNIRAESNVTAANNEKLRNVLLADYRLVATKIAEAEQLGIDVAAQKAKLAENKILIFSGGFIAAGTALATQIAELDALIKQQTEAAEAERQKGTLTGAVKEGTTNLAGVKVAIQENNAEVASGTTGTDGRYSILHKAGSYKVVFSKSDYTSVSKTNIVITAQQSATLDVSMTKAPPATPKPPATTTTGSTTNGDSQYQLTTVLGYSVHLATFNLASGQFRVATDTANDNDCADDCPTKSLSSYVSGNGAFAGMNGTYFCPADYSACVNETNAFFWKVYNTRLGKMINANNGLGENDPFIAFNSAGTARYFSSYNSYLGSGFNATAGINCKPALISGGSNILNVGSLDDKQRHTKSNRGAIGLKGQTLYLVIAKSATVVDLAAIMDELGVDYALNVDGGGSSAMIFNGSYKAGPGRGLPNAIVVARR